MWRWFALCERYLRTHRTSQQHRPSKQARRPVLFSCFSMPRTSYLHQQHLPAAAASSKRHVCSRLVCGSWRM